MEWRKDALHLSHSSEQGEFTSDNFSDIETLQLEPHFAAEVEQAVRPLGVYLNFWQPMIHAKGAQDDSAPPTLSTSGV